MTRREEYINKLAAQLKEWSAKIDELQAKGAKAKAEMKTEYEKQVKTLRVKQEAAKVKLQELTGASEEAWEGIKISSDRIWDELKTAISNTVDKFKKAA